MAGAVRRACRQVPAVVGSDAPDSAPGMVPRERLHGRRLATRVAGVHGQVGSNICQRPSMLISTTTCPPMPQMRVAYPPRWRRSVRSAVFLPRLRTWFAIDSVRDLREVPQHQTVSDGRAQRPRGAAELFCRRGDGNMRVACAPRRLGIAANRCPLLTLAQPESADTMTIRSGAARPAVLLTGDRP